MANSAETCVRAFDGSLADAEGILAVERATFSESPYDAQQVCAMLTDGPQRAWLAMGGDRVAGFVIAFPTHGLRGWWWEVDLLAVLPAWRGRRLASRLIRAATREGARFVSAARAVVATDNGASARAFLRAGFSEETGACKLLIHRLEDQLPQRPTLPGLEVREATSVVRAEGWLAERISQQAAEPPSLVDSGEFTLLQAEQKGQPAGHAELIQVQTLLYRGLWIESLQATERVVREGLIREAVSRARLAGLDEVGAMVPESDRPYQRSLLSQGFRSLGDYCWFRADLRDPGLASLPRPEGDHGGCPQDRHV